MKSFFSTPPLGTTVASFAYASQANLPPSNPNSPQHNTVYLPSQRLGDTRRGQTDRCGALADSKPEGVTLYPEQRNALEAIGLTLILSTSLLGCSAAGTGPTYPQSLVEPITVKQHSGNEISIRYRVPPESGFYSGGVNYERLGDDLRIVIARCEVGTHCEPMAKSLIPLDDKWQAEVRVPSDARRVVVVHSDGETQVYP